jgi:hypothetical protein
MHRRKAHVMLAMPAIALQGSVQDAEAMLTRLDLAGSYKLVGRIASYCHTFNRVIPLQHKWLCRPTDLEQYCLQ